MLPTKTEYEAGQLAVLGDSLEVVAEKVSVRVGLSAMNVMMSDVSFLFNAETRLVCFIQFIPCKLTQAADLAKRIKDPRVGIPVGATTAVLADALYNYHTTLEVRLLNVFTCCV